MIKELAPLINDRTTLVLSLAKEGDKVRLCVMPNRGLPPLTATDTPEALDATLAEALIKYTAAVKPLADAVEEVAKMAETAKAKEEAIAAARSLTKSRSAKLPDAKPAPKPAPRVTKPTKAMTPQEIAEIVASQADAKEKAAVPATTDPALFGQKVDAVRQAAASVRAELAALGLMTDPPPPTDGGLDDFLGTTETTATTTE